MRGDCYGEGWRSSRRARGARRRVRERKQQRDRVHSTGCAHSSQHQQARPCPKGVQRCERLGGRLFTDTGESLFRNGAQPSVTQSSSLSPSRVQLIEAWLGLAGGGRSSQQAYYVYDELAQNPAHASQPSTVQVLVGKAAAQMVLGNYKEANQTLEQAEQLVSKICSTLMQDRSADNVFACVASGSEERGRPGEQGCSGAAPQSSSRKAPGGTSVSDRTSSLLFSGCLTQAFTPTDHYKPRIRSILCLPPTTSARQLSTKRPASSLSQRKHDVSRSKTAYKCIDRLTRCAATRMGA